MQQDSVISPENDRFIEFPYRRHGAIEMRWNAIFIGTKTHAPYQECGEHQPFHVRPSELIEIAQRKPPKRRRATVSAFSDWIYSLYAPPPKIKNLSLASKMERPIFEARHQLFLDQSFQEILPAGYDLYHSDLQVSSLSDRTHFEIPSLTIDGIPITASPDLLYINRYDNRSIIVEVKYTNKPIPLNLWPNIWAQLWAYSKIPIVKASPSVNVAAEIWGGDEWSICLRRTMRKNPREERFDRFFFRFIQDIFIG